MSFHVHSRSFGQGPRKALAIHCTLAHSGAWRGVGQAMGDVLTLDAFDMPCHGKTDDWDGTGNVHDLTTGIARDMIAKQGGPVDLIGHSFGATVALRLAIENPELVRSAVLIEPVFFAAAAVDEPRRVEGYYAKNRDFDAALASGDKMEAARAFNRGWGDGTRWDQIPEQTRQYMADRIHFVGASSAVVLHDSPGLLAPGQFERATMPILLMEGDQSDDMTDAVNSALARRLPHAKRVVLEGLGHMAPITHPKEVAAAIRDFLAQVPFDRASEMA